MNIGMWFVLFLAIVQGLTEFFPVSSSGHLVIFESLLGMRGAGNRLGIVFEVAVHLGTLGAVVIFYRTRIRLLCRAIHSLVFAGSLSRVRYHEELSYIGLIILGSLPAGLLGVAFSDRVEATFSAPALAAVCLVATGLYLLVGRPRATNRNLTWYSALIIGAAQAVAILPGCSRSGWTITTALILGVGFTQAAEFSFMLSIPAVLGATLLEIIKEPVPFTATSMLPLIIGTLVAFLSGLLALMLLIRILTRGAFYRFAYYLIPVGIIAFMYFRFALVGSR